MTVPISTVSILSRFSKVLNTNTNFLKRTKADENTNVTTRTRLPTEAPRFFPASPVIPTYCVLRPTER